MLSNEPQIFHRALYASSAASWRRGRARAKRMPPSLDLFFFTHFLLILKYAQSNFVQILVKTRFLNEVPDVKSNLRSCPGSVGCPGTEQLIGSPSSLQRRGGFARRPRPAISWENPATALTFKGFSIPAVQLSCKCEPSRQGKREEGLGLNFHSDESFLLNCPSAWHVVCVCPQACVWLGICTLLSRLLQKEQRYFMHSLHCAY